MALIFIQATVRSTGTRFIQNIFRKAGLKVYLLGNTEMGTQLADGVHVIHCMPIHMKITENRARRHPIFLNMRHPMRVAESWQKRGWPLGPLFFAQWWNLFHLQDQYNGHWLPIDTEDKDERLANASEIMGVELKTDWKPHCQTEEVLGQDGMSLAEAKKHLKLMPFGQFGYRL